MKQKTHYTVDNYTITVRYECPEGHPELACYTARAEEFPGLTMGGRTPEAALSEARWMIADTLEEYAQTGIEPPVPSSLPPARYPDAQAVPELKKHAARAAASEFGRMGGYVKSAVKAASSRRNLLKARAMGKLGGRPKKKALAAA